VGEVSLNLRLEGALVEVSVELLHVEAELSGVLLKIGALEGTLIGEQLVVHLPELTLSAGGEGCL
jgi:hypothetical protein